MNVSAIKFHNKVAGVMIQINREREYVAVAEWMGELWCNQHVAVCDWKRNWPRA